MVKNWIEHCILDPSSPLEVKGVVFNEMKGVFSSSASFFDMKLQQAMFPGTPYEVFNRFKNCASYPFINDFYFIFKKARFWWRSKRYS